MSLASPKETVARASRATSGTRPLRIHGMLAMVLLAIMVLPLTTGCVAMDMDWGAPCFSKADCPEGQICILGTCTAMPDFEVDVEIIPLPTHEHMAYPVHAVDLYSPEALQIIVPSPTVVSGNLQIDTEPFLRSAQLLFSTEVDLRRPQRHSVEVGGENGRDSNFEVKLVASMLEQGQNRAIPYSVTARPLEQEECCFDDDAACPVPFSMSGVTFPSDVDNLFLAFPDNPTRISGVVLKEDGASQPNVKVLASAANGTIHSLSVSTEENGEFCLAMNLPKDGRDTPVKLRLTPTTFETPSPVFEHEIIVTAGRANRDIELTIGDFDSHQLLEGFLLDKQDEPIGNAVVSFHGEVGSGGSLSATARTGSDGGFTVELLQGDYMVRAIPPASSRAASIEQHGFVLDLDEDGSAPSPLVIVAPDRPPLTGKVFGPGGEQKPMADVEVIALRESAASKSGPGVDAFIVQTDSDGSYELRIDPGPYRLYFKPPARAGLPRMVGPVVEIELGVSQGLTPIVLEEPAFVEGKALGAAEDGLTVPLAGARIEVHARKRNSTYLLWEGRAEDDGTFEVLLPKSLAARVETFPQE